MRSFGCNLRLLVATSTLLGAQACLIDSDRCGAHQVRVEGDFQICACEPNAVFNANGVDCTPCGPNEIVDNGVCACAAGFTRPSADGACESSAIGASCSASAPCSSDFPYCVAAGEADGYCSITGCTSNAACPTGWTCESKDSMRYCRKPVSGLGVSCTSSADCANFEANYCETFQARACIQQGCAAGTVTCPNEWACCDLSSLFNAPLSFCIPPGSLPNGNCPAGTRVNP